MSCAQSIAALQSMTSFFSVPFIPLFRAGGGPIVTLYSSSIVFSSVRSRSSVSSMIPP
jgi:hypothetical protein